MGRGEIVVVGDFSVIGGCLVVIEFFDVIGGV